VLPGYRLTAADVERFASMNGGVVDAFELECRHPRREVLRQVSAVEIIERAMAGRQIGGPVDGLLVA